MSAPGTTPGPWAILGDDEGFDGVPFIEIAAGECGTKTFRPIAHVQPDYDEERDDWSLCDTDQANANLIAASPDLYDALVAICSLVEDAFDGKLAGPQALDAITDIASPALAKARGE